MAGEEGWERIQWACQQADPMPLKGSPRKEILMSLDISPLLPLENLIAAEWSRMAVSNVPFLMRNSSGIPRDSGQFSCNEVYPGMKPGTAERILRDPAIERWMKSRIQNRVDLMTSAHCRGAPSRSFSLRIYRANNVAYGAIRRHRYAKRFIRLLRISRHVPEVNIFFKTSPPREYHFARNNAGWNCEICEMRISIRITIYRRQFGFRGILRDYEDYGESRVFRSPRMMVDGDLRPAPISPTSRSRQGILCCIPTIIPLLKDISKNAVCFGFITLSVHR